MLEMTLKLQVNFCIFFLKLNSLQISKTHILRSDPNLENINTTPRYIWKLHLMTQKYICGSKRINMIIVDNRSLEYVTEHWFIILSYAYLGTVLTNEWVFYMFSWKIEIWAIKEDIILFCSLAFLFIKGH